MEAELEVLNKIEPNTCVKVRDKDHLERIKIIMGRDGYRFYGASEEACLKKEPYLNFCQDFDVVSYDCHSEYFKLVEYELESAEIVPTIESRILAEKVGADVSINQALSRLDRGLQDMIKKPNHYQLLPDYEVKDVNKALLDKIEESSFDMSLYEAGWYQQSMQYFMRFYAKNGLEDLEKGIETMQFVVDSLKARAARNTTTDN